MKKLKISIIIIMSVCLFYSCSEDKMKNTVDPDQVQTDDSSNYRYIFKDRIQKEKEVKKQEIENEFHREDLNEK